MKFFPLPALELDLKMSSHLNHFKVKPSLIDSFFFKKMIYCESVKGLSKVFHILNKALLVSYNPAL